MKSPKSLQTQRTFDHTLAGLQGKDVNYYFDMNDSDLKKKMLKARKRMKSVKK